MSQVSDVSASNGVHSDISLVFLLNFLSQIKSDQNMTMDITLICPQNKKRVFFSTNKFESYV